MRQCLRSRTGIRLFSRSVVSCFQHGHSPLILPGNQRHSMRKILIYSLGLIGAGHFMRMSLLARRLAEQHDVFLVDGGPPIADQIPVPGVTLIKPPRICFRNNDVQPHQPAITLKEVLQLRRQHLESVCRELQPDLIVVEQFPFNKWVISGEVLPMISLARQLKPGMKVVCSVRTPLPVLIKLKQDLLLSPRETQQRVMQILGEHFDLLLIHTDPRFMPLEEEYPWIPEIQIPAESTGFICQPTQEPVPNGDGAFAPPAAQRTGTLVSGGGAGGEQLRRCSIEAWRLLSQTNEAGSGRLTLVLPSNPDDREIQELQQAAGDLPVDIRRFSPEFHGWMQQAELSISHAGYNTCSDLLQTRTRAVLVPYSLTGDQPERARHFAERGLAAVIAPGDLTGPAVASAVRRARSLPEPRHNFDLNGVERSCELIEQLLANSVPAWKT